MILIETLVLHRTVVRVTAEEAHIRDRVETITGIQRQVLGQLVSDTCKALISELSFGI